MTRFRRLSRSASRARSAIRALDRKQWIAIVLLIAAAPVFVFAVRLVLGAALAKESSLLTTFFLALIGVATMIAAIVATLPEPAAGSSSPEPAASRLSLKTAAFVLLAVNGALGAMATWMSLSEPSLSTLIARTNATTADTNRRVRTLVPDTAPILEHIGGRWGEQEPACGLVWNITIKGDSLTAEIVRRPSGVEPYKLVAQIVSAKGNVLDVVAEEPASARGFGAQFRYSDSGKFERLVWDDRKRASDLLEYHRCQ